MQKSKMSCKFELVFLIKTKMFDKLSIANLLIALDFDQKPLMTISKNILISRETLSLINPQQI